MAYFVDRVVICDAYAPPDRHYEILPGGRSKLVPGRRPSKRYVVGGREARGGRVDGAIVDLDAAAGPAGAAPAADASVSVVELITDARERLGHGLIHRV